MNHFGLPEIDIVLMVSQNTLLQIVAKLQRIQESEESSIILNIRQENKPSIRNYCSRL